MEIKKGNFRDGYMGSQQNGLRVTSHKTLLPSCESV